MHDRHVLRTALETNAIFSFACAAVLIAGSPWLAPAIGLASVWPMVVLGLGLLPFAGYVRTLARDPELSARMGGVVSTMDATWVVATGVLLVAWPDALNAAGQWLAIAIAAVVAGLAAWQLVGVRRIARPA